MSEHVFDGKPDARQQQPGESVKVSRFRPRFRNLTPDEKSLHDQIKASAEELCDLIESTPSGRYRSLAVTALEESVMWAVKGLTA